MNGEKDRLLYSRNGPRRAAITSCRDSLNGYQKGYCFYCASLLHVPASGLPEAMHRLAAALKPGGVWYLSFKYGSGERVKEGRHFTDQDEAGLAELLAMLPQLSALAVWQTLDKRPERDEVWLNGLLHKR
ncbi:hypothetical protein RZA61_000180 [Pluralibacter gergoviae]|nr:hypothetical protein [Pluralibacter gergoviae]